MEPPTFLQIILMTITLSLGSLLMKFLFRRKKESSVALDHQSVALTHQIARNTDHERAAVPRAVHSNSDGGRQEGLGTQYGGRRLLSVLHEDAQTAHQWFERAVRCHGDKPFLGTLRPDESGFAWQTFKEVGEKVEALAAGLASLGCSQKDRVAALGTVRPEVTICEYACYRNAYIYVPISNQASSVIVSHIVEDTFPGVVLCDGNRVQTILKIQAHKCSTINTIVAFDSVSDELKAEAETQSVSLLLLEDVLDQGRIHPAEAAHPTPNDIASITYTSGTTSSPKGVLLSHGNLVASASAQAVQIPLDTHQSQPVAPVVLAFGGMSHIMPRLGVFYCLEHGGRIGMYNGPLVQDKLEEVQKLLRPTRMVLVPSLVYKMVEVAHRTLLTYPYVVRSVMQTIARLRLRQIRQRSSLSGGILDWLAFRQLRNNVGGRLETIYVGSAPLSAQTAQLIRCYYACNVVEAYGKTESTGAGSISLTDDPTHGHVGAPSLCNHIKLVSVPDTEYDAFYSRGEVCIKGPSVCKGLWVKGECLDTPLDADGWLRTGDVGRWRENGTLEIIERIGNLITLTNGVSVSPEKTESYILELPFIENVYIYGSNTREFTVAVVTPLKEELLPFLEEKGASEDVLNKEMDDLCQNELVQELIMDAIKKLCIKRGLTVLQLPGAIYLNSTPFAEIPDALTATLKMRRSKLKEVFAAALEGMYTSLKKKRNKSLTAL